MKTIKIGFVGYSLGKFNIDGAKKILDHIFLEIQAKYKNRGYDIEIVTGATALGIPLLAYQYAEKDNYKTIGIMCKKGYDFKLYPCDIIYAIGNDWGDESETFINYIDVLYKVGGGKQSINESKLAIEQNKIVYDFELAEIKG